jgi:hypothetical protein
MFVMHLVYWGNLPFNFGIFAAASLGFVKSGTVLRLWLFGLTPFVSNQTPMTIYLVGSTYAMSGLILGLFTANMARCAPPIQIGM